jgi:flagellar biosynthetic protein FliR
VDAGVSLSWVFASLLLSLRIGPVFALAPPFSLTRTPAFFRALFGVGLAGVIAASPMIATPAIRFDPGFLAAASAKELALGLLFVLALQFMFAALNVAGRTLDIQAGFGLAAVIDPSTGSQTPLIGSFLTYAAAALFFALDGHADLVRIIAASIQAIPLGVGAPAPSASVLARDLSVLFTIAFAVAGGAMLCLFLADMTIALMSRTLPQMNVLILGLQVKSILILLALPMTLALAGALLVRLTAITLEMIVRWL